MQSSVQIRTEFYNALANSVTLQGFLGNPMRLTWLGSVTIDDTFPKATFYKADTEGQYSFGTNLEAEDLVFEVQTYVDTQDASESGYKCDLINDAMKVALNAIGYRQLGSPAEVLDESINKIVSVTRWERINA